MAIKPIEINELENRTANVYEAVVVLSKNAKQISEETKIEYNQRTEIVNSKIKEDTISLELPINPDQIKLSKEFEKRKKSTDQAIENLLHDDITYVYREEN